VAVVALTFVGFAAAAVALWENRNTMMSLPGFAWRTSEEAFSKSSLYYFAHGIQIAVLVVAGALALLKWASSLPSRVLLTFGVLQVAGATMAVRGLTADDLFSARLFASTGPFVTLVSIFAFTAIRKSEFEVFDKVFVFLAAGFSLALLYAMATLESLGREDVVNSLQGLLNVLYWLATWAIVRPIPRGVARRVLRWVPLLLYAAGSLLTQTRLNFVMLALAVIASIYVTARRTGRRLSSIGGLVAAVAMGALGAVLLAETPISAIFGEAAAGLAERLSDDTRTSQLVTFFASVEPWELILGRGSRATWNWPGMSATWAGGTDVGYLSLLFFGGLPLLGSYVAFHFTPVLRVLRAPGNPASLAPAVMVALWGVRMISSSFPSFTLEYYPVLIFVGACLGGPLDVEAAKHRR
jgi:hypothetical protein